MKVWFKNSSIRWIVCVLSLGAMLCVTAFASAFPDVPDSAPYVETVNTLAEMGIMNGGSDGNFDPNGAITRAEAAVVICKLLGVEATARESKFPDVPSSEWSVSYVAKASELGILSGYNNGNFGPNDLVTYEQMVKMLISAWGYDDEAALNGGWPNGYINIAKQLRIIDKSQGPTPCARSTVATLVYNTFQIPSAYETGGNIDE